MAVVRKVLQSMLAALVKPPYLKAAETRAASQNSTVGKIMEEDRESMLEALRLYQRGPG